MKAQLEKIKFNNKAVSGQTICTSSEAVVELEIK